MTSTPSDPQVPAKKPAKKGKELRKWLRRGAFAVVALGVVGLMVMAAMPTPLPVDVAEVRRGNLRVTVDEDGKTRVVDRYLVSAPLSGNLARIELDPGAAVRQGDVLARLVPIDAPMLDARTRAEANARVGVAEAQVAQARLAIERGRVASEFLANEATRQRNLADSGSLAAQVAERAEMDARTAREELRSLEFGVRVAESQLRLAQTALRRLEGGTAGEQIEVVSPIDGHVLRLAQESAGVVQVGAPLLELGDKSHLEIVVDVLTSDAVRIRPGIAAELERWGGEGVLRAHVKRIEPSAFTRISALGVEEQRVNVVLELDDPRERWESLGDGYRVEARILVTEVTDVVLVPSSALFRHGDDWAVYAVESAHVVRRIVRTGERNGIDVQVLEGLAPGAVVVVHPSDAVKEGVEVERRK